MLSDGGHGSPPSRGRLKRIVKEFHMGRVVSFANMPMQQATDGVARAAIAPDAREMAAELVRIAPGKHFIASVPRGSDGYLFGLAGTTELSSGAQRHRVGPHSFA